jgi:hypothetical protein
MPGYELLFAWELCCVLLRLPKTFTAPRRILEPRHGGSAVKTTWRLSAETLTATRVRLWRRSARKPSPDRATLLP